MHIEKLSVKDREVIVRLSADEIVKLCNSLLVFSAASGLQYHHMYC